jgi:lysine-specific histone demethylase 1
MPVQFEHKKLTAWCDPSEKGINYLSKRENKPVMKGKPISKKRPIMAALASNLPVDSMSPLELKYLNYSSRLYEERDYIDIRNTILVRWFSNVKEYLTKEKACASIAKQHLSLAHAIYEFLNRFGYINIGFLSNSEQAPLQFNGNNTSNKDHTFKHVVIVGAGIAGIMAAHKLTQLGYKVTMLEARHRTGGRIFTDVNSGYAVDLGASILTGADANPIYTVLNKQIDNIDLYDIGDTGALYDIDGNMVDEYLDKEVEKQFNKLLDAACDLKHAGNSSKRKKYTQTANQPIDMLSLGDILFKMIDEYLDTISNRKKRELHKRILYWHVSNLEYGMGTELKPCSLAHWDQDDEYEIMGQHKFLKQGYSSIVNLLTKNLDIKLGQVVTNIEYSGETIVVSTKPNTVDHVNPIVANNQNFLINDNDDSLFSSENKMNNSDLENSNEKLAHEIMDGAIVSVMDSYLCDAVLITVPLGVLQKRSIYFNPPLPQWKIDAIDRLGMGVLNKLVLTFPYVFWDNEMDYFGSLHEQSERRGHHYLFWNMYPCIAEPVLVALFAGNAAHELENEELDNILTDTMNALRNIFGSDIPNPVKYLKTNWFSDPFATGTYSYIKVGSTGNDMDTLSMPVEEKLFFAGEATWRCHPSTVLGALLSGLREAGRIDYELSKKRNSKHIALRKSPLTISKTESLLTSSPDKSIGLRQSSVFKRKISPNSSVIEELLGNKSPKIDDSILLEYRRLMFSPEVVPHQSSSPRASSLIHLDTASSTASRMDLFEIERAKAQPGESTLSNSVPTSLRLNPDNTSTSRYANMHNIQKQSSRKPIPATNITAYSSIFDSSMVSDSVSKSQPIIISKNQSQARNVPLNMHRSMYRPSFSYRQQYQYSYDDVQQYRYIPHYPSHYMQNSCATNRYENSRQVYTTSSCAFNKGYEDANVYQYVPYCYVYPSYEQPADNSIKLHQRKYQYNAYNSQ